MWGMSPFVNNVCSNFIKVLNFFTSLIMNQKYVVTSICRIFGSNLDIIVIIMCYFRDKNFKLSLEGNIIFLHLWYMVCNGTYESKKYFCAIFRILLEGHVVQLRITFNKDIESQLNDRKYQIYLEIIQTPTWQLICCLLHLKNVFIVFNIVYVQVASQRCLNFLF